MNGTMSDNTGTPSLHTTDGPESEAQTQHQDDPVVPPEGAELASQGVNASSIDTSTADPGDSLQSLRADEDVDVVTETNEQLQELRK